MTNILRKHWSWAASELLGFCLLAVLAGAAAAQSSTPQPPTDDQVNAVARELYCPVCENIPLDVCGTQACAQWRDLIRLKLSQGWSKEQIKTYFADQYGDRVLPVPPRQGLNWLIYILPVVIIVGALAVLAFVLRGMRRKRGAVPDGVQVTAPAAGQTPPQDEYRQRMEEELKKLK